MIGDISDKETYFKFESITKNGGLMSLQKLKELGISQSERLIRLNESARNQMKISKNNCGITELKKIIKYIEKISSKVGD